MDPPPHIPSVSNHLANPNSPISAGVHSPTAVAKTSSAATSIKGVALPAHGHHHGHHHHHHGHGHTRDSMAVLDDLGGEWEREGLGKGLEERLEALTHQPIVGIKS